MSTCQTSFVSTAIVKGSIVTSRQHRLVLRESVVIRPSVSDSPISTDAFCSEDSCLLACDKVGKHKNDHHHLRRSVHIQQDMCQIPSVDDS